MITFELPAYMSAKDALKGINFNTNTFATPYHQIHRSDDARAKGQKTPLVLFLDFLKNNGFADYHFDYVEERHPSLRLNWAKDPTKGSHPVFLYVENLYATLKTDAEKKDFIAEWFETLKHSTYRQIWWEGGNGPNYTADLSHLKHNQAFLELCGNESAELRQWAVECMVGHIPALNDPGMQYHANPGLLFLKDTKAFTARHPETRETAINGIIAGLPESMKKGDAAYIVSRNTHRAGTLSSEHYAHFVLDTLLAMEAPDKKLVLQTLGTILNIFTPLCVRGERPHIVNKMAPKIVKILGLDPATMDRPVFGMIGENVGGIAAVRPDGREPSLALLFGQRAKGMAILYSNCIIPVRTEGAPNITGIKDGFALFGGGGMQSRNDFTELTPVAKAVQGFLRRGNDRHMSKPLVQKLDKRAA